MALSTSFEFNDTLQITKEQWFPDFLDIQSYLDSEGGIDPILYRNVLLQFCDKPRLRNYVVPPVRCFLVENKDGKRIYRWHCQIQSITLDYIAQTTSGIFVITHLFAPQDIRIAHRLIDCNPQTDYFWS